MQPLLIGLLIGYLLLTVFWLAVLYLWMRADEKKLQRELDNSE